MTQSGKKRSLFQRWVPDPNRREALYFALPYLCFLALPLWNSFSEGIDRNLNLLTVFLVVALGAAYVASWLLNPIAPRSRDITGIFVATMGIVAALALILSLIGLPHNPGILFCFSFVSSPWMLLAPKRILAPGILLIVLTPVILGASFGVDWGITAATVGVTGGTGGVCFVSRLSIQRQEDKDRDIENAHLLQQERQRSQMAADLHDILGQDLTGLALKAELAGKLLETGHVDQAKIEVQQVAELSRAALSDVRTVVSGAREWVIDRELEGAVNVLRSSGIAVHQDIAEDIYLQPQSSMMARILREASTNIVSHSRAKNCWITITRRSLLINNDGYSKQLATQSAGSGAGLVGLRDLVSNVGELTWGATNGHWVVKFEVSG